MAKDVDLSSKEWRDLVFEGKNKEFGAYTLRSDSPRRHTFAIVVVLGVLAVILAFLILWITGVFKSAEEDTNANAGQQAVNVESVEEEVEEEEFQEFEQPEPEEVPQEETAATQAVTELNLVVEVDKDKEIKNTDEKLDDTRQFGNENIEGTEDLNKVEVIKDVVVEKPKVEEKPKPEAIMDMAMVEQKPSFPGGDAALYKWLGSNIVYPAAASEEGVQGKVIVAFVVEKDGSITNVQVVRKKHPALDAEAVRAVKKMPKWTPGRNNGQPVRVKYNLPVSFTLQN